MINGSLEKKDLDAIKEHFYWPGMIHDMHRVIQICVTCAKSKEDTQGLYMPLSVTWIAKDFREEIIVSW